MVHVIQRKTASHKNNLGQKTGIAFVVIYLQNGILLFIIFHLYLIQTVMVLSAALCVDDREI